MSDVKEILKEKLDPILLDMVGQTDAKIPVIIQTIDGLQDDDANLVEKNEGEVKDNLYIINAFSADMPADRIPEVAKSKRVVRIYFDSEVRAV